MNDTPRGDRLHIALFGRRNAGKSSLINALTHQKVAVVSDIPGTTTDPVYKSMEVLPLGPVVFIDTPGIDDKGMLGEMRIEKTKEILRKTDIGVLVVTRDTYWGEQEESITEQFIKRGVPFVIVINKCEDRMDDNDRGNLPEFLDAPIVKISALTGEGIDVLIAKLAELKKDGDQETAPCRWTCWNRRSGYIGYTH